MVKVIKISNFLIFSCLLFLSTLPHPGLLPRHLVFHNYLLSFMLAAGLCSEIYVTIALILSAQSFWEPMFGDWKKKSKTTLSIQLTWTCSLLFDKVIPSARKAFQQWSMLLSLWELKPISKMSESFFWGGVRTSVVFVHEVITENTGLNSSFGSKLNTKIQKELNSKVCKIHWNGQFWFPWVVS